VSGPEHLPTMTAKGSALTTAATTPASVSAATDVRFAPGAIIAGRYRLIALLGKGGMGEVYRADDLILAQPVALKFMLIALALFGFYASRAGQSLFGSILSEEK
jgi:hypothetical protein